MTPPPCRCAAARPHGLSAPRPLDVVNAEIHQLVERAPLVDADQVRLAGLYAEWLAAVEREQAVAAA